jgi:hypothetical protein
MVQLAAGRGKCLEHMQGAATRTVETLVNERASRTVPAARISGSAEAHHSDSVPELRRSGVAIEASVCLRALRNEDRPCLFGRLGPISSFPAHQR